MFYCALLYCSFYKLKVYGNPVSSKSLVPFFRLILKYIHLFRHNATRSLQYSVNMGFLDGSVVRNLPANGGNVSSIPGSGRSPGDGNGNPLQCYCLESCMDRGAWWATVHGGCKRVRHDLAIKQQCKQPLYALGKQICVIHCCDNCFIVEV